VEDENKHRMMLYCHILIGEYTKGEGSMTTPPVKQDGETQYDTLVDNITKPQIFVVCKDHKAIPKYLIKYARK